MRIYLTTIGWVIISSVSIARYYYTLTLFAHKTKILAVGGQGSQKTAEAYDSTNYIWTNTRANMSTSRYSHVAVLLDNERILIMGGQTSDGTVLASAEIYIPSSDSFLVTNSMSTSRVSVHYSTID